MSMFERGQPRCLTAILSRQDSFAEHELQDARGTDATPLQPAPPVRDQLGEVHLVTGYLSWRCLIVSLARLKIIGHSGGGAFSSSIDRARPKMSGTVIWSAVTPAP